MASLHACLIAKELVSRGWIYAPILDDRIGNPRLIDLDGKEYSVEEAQKIQEDRDKDKSNTK